MLLRPRGRLCDPGTHQAIHCHELLPALAMLKLSRSSSSSREEMRRGLMLSRHLERCGPHLSLLHLRSLLARPIYLARLRVLDRLR